MRIIDKQHDFYDYYQDPTDTIVFDRRGSFLLTKKDICDGIGYARNLYYKDFSYRLLLVQCCFTFWLFLIHITDYDEFNMVNNYETELLVTWKNYDKSNELIKVDLIDVHSVYGLYDYRLKDYNYSHILNNIDNFKNSINRNDYSSMKSFNEDKRHFNKKTNTFGVPLLKACGIAELMDAQEVFCAIEEHFSQLKTDMETTEAKGATNDDKIIMHGFDTKFSFRGK